MKGRIGLGVITGFGQLKSLSGRESGYLNRSIGLCR